MPTDDEGNEVCDECLVGRHENCTGYVTVLEEFHRVKGCECGFCADRAFEE